MSECEAQYQLARVAVIESLPMWLCLRLPWLARAIVWIRTRTARRAARSVS